jgi:uncharacterized membrane protein
MSKNKIKSAVFAFVILIPIWLPMLWSGFPQPDHPDEFDMYWALTRPVFYLYQLPMFLGSLVLIYRTDKLSVGMKVFWVAIVLVLSVVGTILLAHRLYWHESNQVPKNLDDQRRILRENVAKIRAGEKLP